MTIINIVIIIIYYYEEFSSYSDNFVITVESPNSTASFNIFNILFLLFSMAYFLNSLILSVLSAFQPAETILPLTPLSLSCPLIRSEKLKKNEYIMNTVPGPYNKAAAPTMT